MDIQTKYREVILNAKCEYVCAVDKLVKKMNYGEDACCCANKLYLASRLINRLECYCFETPVLVETEILPQFTLEINNNDFLAGTIVTFAVNGVQVYSYTSDAEYKPTVWENVFNTLNYDYTIAVGATTVFTLTLDCNVIECVATATKSGVVSPITLTNTVVGTCATSNPPCYNCISNSDLPKMYEVLNKLLQ